MTLTKENKDEKDEKDEKETKEEEEEQEEQEETPTPRAARPAGKPVDVTEDVLKDLTDFREYLSEIGWVPKAKRSPKTERPRKHVCALGEMCVDYGMKEIIPREN